MINELLFDEVRDIYFICAYLQASLQNNHTLGLPDVQHTIPEVEVKMFTEEGDPLGTIKIMEDGNFGFTLELSDD
jgi:hypothetical protein